ncbi:outer membrane protein [Actibacterium sp. XHP0104]|uniref:outer membrane protein n=1 Tax=Actibacterium sp. XHP0104 TaxID=2984335 RepID=UPI0021E7774D|nr:outer membrane beta-barrel protein [Actibacterium sp. XHP0104]MCV2881192.1 outer membrane beta-barrel protein [Actibacterium sp. XHP0104]
MKKMITLAAMTLVAAGPALAGNIAPVLDEPVVAAPAPVYAEGHDWTGGYVGGQLGFAAPEADGGLDGDGVIGGVHAGYNYDFGDYVLGGELSYDAASIDMNGGELTDAIRLKAKAGYDLGKTLVYGTAGAARLQADLGGGSDWDTGYFVGAGVEHMLTTNVSVGGEVLYDKVSNFAGSGADLSGPSVAARASFHF